MAEYQACQCFSARSPSILFGKVVQITCSMARRHGARPAALRPGRGIRSVQKFRGFALTTPSKSEKPTGTLNQELSSVWPGDLLAGKGQLFGERDGWKEEISP
jgi:hypothetical protein